MIWRQNGVLRVGYGYMKLNLVRQVCLSLSVFHFHNCFYLCFDVDSFCHSSFEAVDLLCMVYFYLANYYFNVPIRVDFKVKYNKFTKYGVKALLLSRLFDVIRRSVCAAAHWIKSNTERVSSDWNRLAGLTWTMETMVKENSYYLFELFKQFTNIYTKLLA